RIESRNEYIPCSHPEDDHTCIFLICTRCQAIDEVHGDEVVAALRDVAKSKDFSLGRNVIESYGICNACA
ncbi:MAG: hypothetical protein AAGF15_08090, partial [Pseudomonadota bacterium]